MTEPNEDSRHRIFFAQMIEHLMTLARQGDDLPDAQTPIGQMTREFFENNWHNAADLLDRSHLLRVAPMLPDAPRVFRFEIDRPYLRKELPAGSIEVAAGPIRGTLRYRPDLFTADPEEPTILVTMDDQNLLHPNHSREHGYFCYGQLPPGPYPLDAMLEHLYRLLSYQAWSTEDPADLEAALIFVSPPAILEELGPIQPLYGVEEGVR